MGFQSLSREQSETPAQFSSLSGRNVPPMSPLPLLSPSLSRSLRWSLTSYTVICHKCLMSHSRRKWDDHMIRPNCKHLQNIIQQANLDIVAVGGFLSVSIRRFDAFLHLSFCNFLFSFPQTTPLLVFSVFSYLVPPPLFFIHPTWLPFLHWQEIIPSLSCWKMENDDKLSLIMCSLCSMSISEQSGPKKDQGELAYLHVFILNLTAEPPWCFLNRDTLCFYSYSHFYVYNDFLVIMPVLQLVWRGFFKIIFVEECSQLHPFKCLFLQSKHAPSRHRPSSSLCQV